MSIRGLKRLALLLTFWVALQVRCLKADQTITGNLTVTGTADIYGDSLTAGSLVGTSNTPAWGIGYTDGTNSFLVFNAARPGNTWKWQQNAGTSAQVQMSLSNSNVVTLYSPGSSPTAEITLSPLSTGTSTFAGSVTISGTNNTIPNQALTGSSSVLTRGLADSRYLSSSSSGITTGSATYNFFTGTTIGLNGGSATEPDSFAEGHDTTASGLFSTALGEQAKASGSGSTAIGQGVTANGDYSVAMGVDGTASGLASTVMGWYSSASGYYAIAMGDNSLASGEGSTALGGGMATGYWSTAMGLAATASGSYATASGYGTSANAFDSFVVGVYNVGASSSNAATTWNPTDPLFEVGNGGNGYGYGAGNPAVSGPSDALVVYKNGNAAVQNNLTTGGTFNAGGTVTAPSVVLTTQSGDIPMYTGDQ